MPPANPDSCVCVCVCVCVSIIYIIISIYLSIYLSIYIYRRLKLTNSALRGTPA
jgi:hypothetical protein